MSLDLEKRKEQLDLRKEIVLNLSKKLFDENIKCNVILCMDYSGSMSNYYRTGEVQEAVERILPLAMAFDPDGKAPFILFSDNVEYSGEITSSNIFDSVEKARKGIRMGGTEFYPVLNHVGKLCGVSNSIESVKSGIMSFFGLKKKNDTISTDNTDFDLPTFVLFFTDGDCFDREEAKNEIIRLSKYPIFFQFVGIGHIDSQFLHHLDNMPGRHVDNANYFSINGLGTDMSDEQYYAKLLGEFPSFIKECKNKKMIK